MATASQGSMHFGRLGEWIINRLSSDDDAKIVIIGRNSSTGIGKSTLAIQLCRFASQNMGHEWSAKDKGAYWNVDKYYKDYNDRKIPEGSAVLLDEIEAIADRRSWMTQENKTLIQAWSKLRNRNVLNVCTLPSTSQLDKQLLQLSDVLIIVEERGKAAPYFIQVNDFTHKMSYHHEFFNEERIQFKKIPKSDEDYAFIEKMKTEGDSDFELIRRAVCEEEKEKAVKKAKQEMRNQLIRGLYEKFDVTQKEIQELEFVDVSRRRVGHIVRGES